MLRLTQYRRMISRPCELAVKGAYVSNYSGEDCGETGWRNFIPPATLSSEMLDHFTALDYLKAAPGGSYEHQKYRLGCLGRILLKNLKTEWWKFVKESGFLQSVSAGDQFINVAENSEIEVVNTMEHLLQTQMKAITLQYDNSEKNVLIVGEMVQSLRSGVSHTEMDQLRFMKHLYNHPSRLKVTNQESLGDVIQHRRAFYDTNEASFGIQDVKVYRHGRIDVRDRGKRMIMTMINLNELFFSILLDAFAKRKDYHYLLLNPGLIPVKIMVLCNVTDKESDTLKLTNELCDMITSWNITCWNGMHKNLTVEDADKLGCLFSIIVGDSVTENGLVYLRSITTTLAMEVHVTQLHKVLCRYLNSLYSDDSQLSSHYQESL